MRHQAPPPPGPHVPVGQVADDTVAHLRLRWHQEDSPEQDTEYQQWAREIALRRGVQVPSIKTAGEPVAFAQRVHQGRQAEITEVYVDAHHRGAGLGTALTRAAIESAGDIDHLWICADDEDRAKELYARLGFRPAWSAMEFTLWPEAVDDISKRSP
jgi:ribosomal protein S18 acetylase RimI-like enzyme